MNEFKFISYEKTPQDPYILGVATILAYGKIVLRFKHSKTKDGVGDFFAPASYGIVDETGQKRYIDSFSLDSSMEKEQLMAFVRRNVLMLQKGIPAKPDMLPMPHGLPAQAAPQLTPTQFEFSGMPQPQYSPNDNMPF